MPSDVCSTGTNKELIPRAKPNEKNMIPINDKGTTKFLDDDFITVNIMIVSYS